MFSIVTTQPILEKLYAERSVWGDIVGLTKKFYVRYESDGEKFIAFRYAEARLADAAVADAAL